MSDWARFGGQDIGARLREARRRAGKSQTEVAAALGRRPSMVCMWEAGSRGINMTDLVAYAMFVHASVSDLVGELPAQHGDSLKGA